MDTQINLDLTHIPLELKVILEILKKTDDEFLEINKEEINWTLFVEQALHHRIYPLLYSILKKNKDFVPTEIFQTLHHYFRMNTFQMLNLTSEMKKVSELLTNNQIRVLFLKGPILGADLYGDISLRTSNDLDFLVPLHDLEKAEQLLLKNGYIKDDYFDSVLSDWKWRHHHITFIHPEKNIKLEVHWRLNPGPGKEPNFNQLWERKSISSIMRYPIFILGKEDLFYFLVKHGARHGWSRLRWLIDIDQIVQKNINWVKLNQLLKEYHDLHIGGQAIILSSQLLGTIISEEMKSFIQGKRAAHLAQESIFYLERMVNLHTEPVLEDISNYHQRHLYSLMSTYQKCIYVFSMLYPYPSDVETLPLPKKIHFLYFPLRPFLCVWRKTRKRAYP